MTGGGADISREREREEKGRGDNLEQTGADR